MLPPGVVATVAAVETGATVEGVLAGGHKRVGGGMKRERLFSAEFDRYALVVLYAGVVESSCMGAL